MHLLATQEDLRNLLQLSDEGIARLRRAGLPTVKVGASVRYYIPTVERFLEKMSMEEASKQIDYQVEGKGFRP